MRILGSSFLALVAASLVGVGAAAACQTADLAGDWATTFQTDQRDYCTLTLDATGAITQSACWEDQIEATPQYTVTGAFVVDEATCKVTAQLGAGESDASQAKYLSGARKAKIALQHKASKKGALKGTGVQGRHQSHPYGDGTDDGNGDGNGGGSGSQVTLSGHLTTDADLVTGLMVRDDGEFGPAIMTRAD